MGTFEFVFAAALLTAPPELSTPLIATPDYPAPNGGTIVSPAVYEEYTAWVHLCRPSLITFAIADEILDPRETPFLLYTDAVFSDMRMLQSRHRDFANTPRLDEADRFPDAKTIAMFMPWNRTLRNQLQNRLTVDVYHATEIRDAMVETDQLYQIWDALRDATCPYYYVPVRRQALITLRELIGAGRFYSGELPAPLPLHHVPR